ncbi:MAG: DNA primase small subunit domain-containing protein [Candidatus Helarchaeota archaeon]
MSKMNGNTQATSNFIASEFKKYYQEKFSENLFLTAIEKREFGFIDWISRKFQRHMGFSNIQDLIKHFKLTTPVHIYTSASRYKKPYEKNMKAKEFIDCDLIFDLDIDHIPTSCKEEHDKWVCKTCGTSGRGIAPEICPSSKCNSNSFQEASWECDKCMKIAKDQIINIVEDFLSKDFGLIPNKDLFIVFSGQRGYHIHVEKENFRNLDTNARREIVDYVTGRGLVPNYHGLTPSADKKPNIFEGGWRGRIARLVLRFFQESSLDELQRILTKNIDVENARKIIISQLNSENPAWSFKKIGDKTWHRLIITAIDKFGMKIDEPVTIDIHRLIRLPGSLHGKTGFLVKKIKFNELEKFDPFSHAQVFVGSKKIHVKETPPFRLGDDSFGPYKDEYVTLPMNAAIYLLCKGLATL